MKKDWIKRLPPGEYTMKEIKAFGKLSSNTSAKIMLLKYGAKIKLVQIGESSRFKDVFVWPGFKSVSKDKKE